MKKISVITVNYNNRIGLENTILSVISQDYEEKEYIVIDGASADGSKNVILKYVNHIAYWVSEPDNGIYDAMNKAILKATGDYVIFLNSGDCFSSHNILNKVFSRKVKADLLVGRQLFVGKNGKAGKSPLLHEKEINMEYFFSSTLPHQSTFIRRELFSICGNYDVSYKVCADWVFWIKAVVEYKCTIAIIPYSVSYMEQGGVSSNMKKCHQDMQRYLQDCMNRGIVSWENIFNLALKSRTQDICTRHVLLRFINKVTSWIGKRI